MITHLRVFIPLILIVLTSLAPGDNLATKKPADTNSDPDSSLPSSPYSGKMELSDDYFDFGFLPGQSKVSHIFWLKNIGPDTLEIIRIKPGCSCTKTPLRKRLLAAGDSSDIEIIFSSGRYKGNVTKSPIINTSDPQGREKKLRFAGYVVYEGDTATAHPLEITPFGLNVKVGEELSEYRIKVKNISNKPVSLKLVSNNPEVFEVSLPLKEIKPGKTGEIVLKLLGLDYYRIPGFEKSFTIELSDPGTTRYTIPVKYEPATSTSAVQPANSRAGGGR